MAGRMARLQTENVYRRISALGHPDTDVVTELRKWVAEGKCLRKWELQLLIKELRKYRRYNHALQVSEWMENGRRYKLGLSDHAIRLDLIAKVHGIASAENYFDSLPRLAKVEPTYGALLNSYVTEKLTEKAVLHMKKMQDFGCASTTLPYNEMLTLYGMTGNVEKLSLILSEMKTKNIPHDKVTYNIRMNFCANMADIHGVEKVLDEMVNNPKIKIDWSTLANLANIYIKAGLFDKAQITLERIEKSLDTKNREAFNFLITLFANACNKDGVLRTWELLKSSFPKLTNNSFICMLSSLIKLDDLEGAERIFEEWLSAGLSYDWRVPNKLIDAYVRKGLIDMAETFIQNCSKNGKRPIGKTWEILAEGFLRNGEIEKAADVMEKALIEMAEMGWRPKPANLEVIFKHLQEKGDTRAEKFLIVFKDANFVTSKKLEKFL